MRRPEVPQDIPMVGILLSTLEAYYRLLYRAVDASHGPNEWHDNDERECCTFSTAFPPAPGRPGGRQHFFDGNLTVITSKYHPDGRDPEAVYYQVRDRLGL